MSGPTRGTLPALIGIALCGFVVAARAESKEEPRCHARAGATGYSGTSSDYEFDGGEGRLRVRKVAPGSPAAEAGLEAGDVVVAIDGRPLRFGDTFEMAHAAAAWRPRDVVRFGVRREDDLRTVRLVLVEPPPGWQERLSHWLHHLELERRAEGWATLQRLSADGPIEVTFHRDSSCGFRSEVDGRPVPLPLTLAAGLRVVPLLERLRRGDAIALRVHISGNAIDLEPVSLPDYLRERDLTRAVQETVQRDHAHREADHRPSGSSR